MFKRLYMVQAIMVNALPHICSLNPRGFRLFEARGFLKERKKNVLDGTLLWQYVSMHVNLQMELADAAQTSRDVILDSLLEIDLMISKWG